MQLKQTHTENHTTDSSKRKITGQLQLDRIFENCETFKMSTKQVRLNIASETVGLQDTSYSTLATDITVTINILSFFVPTFIPDPESQIMFNNSMRNSFTKPFDSWTTERKMTFTGKEYQVDIGSAQKNNSPNYLKTAHQTKVRAGASKRANIISIFDTTGDRERFCENDGIRYPKDF